MNVMTLGKSSSSTTCAVTLPPCGTPTLVDEMNHRIANSLQLLTAMVSVEARCVTDPAALASLEATRARIAAIAGVHRQLCRMPDSEMVNMRDYLEDLCAGLEAGSALPGRHILIDADETLVPADQAGPIGIIVSELVSNAFKHGYAPMEPGDVRIVLSGTPFGGRHLEVLDRGCGRPFGLAGGGAGLGTRLVELMAVRLGASHGWYNARPGTRFVMSW